MFTHAGDMVDNIPDRNAWLQDSRANPMFAKLVNLFGQEKLIFVENPPISKKAGTEKDNVEMRKCSTDVLLNIVRNNNPARFSIEELERVQHEYDKAVAELEEQKKKAIADAATKEAKQQLDREFAEKERRLQQEHAEKMNRSVDVRVKNSCVLF